jgi:type II secretory pathway predicted ATPase ExeA
MYEAFFQLKNRPFPATPSTEFYFPAAAIDEAYCTASRCIERAEGPCLVIGPAGTGKSLLCHLLAERFDEAFHVAMLSCAQLCTRRALLQNLLFELNLPYRGLEEGELRLSLIDFLAPERSSRDGMLLLVDEAHTLPLRLVEEIRMITNLVRDGRPRVRLVMAGNPILEERFTNPKLESLNQRLAARCYLQSLVAEETGRYISSQLVAAGGDPGRIMTDEGMRAVHQATDGVPRLINQLCDHALVLAAVGRRQPVDPGVIQEAWADLQQLPAPWQAAVQEAPVDGSVVEFGTLEDDGTEAFDDEPADRVLPQHLWDEAPASDARAADASERDGQVQLRVAEVERADEPSAGICPPAHAAALPECTCAAEPVAPVLSCDNPFDEWFEQEEVIVDRYATLAAAAQGPDPQDSSRDRTPATEMAEDDREESPAPPAESPHLAVACADHAAVAAERTPHDEEEPAAVSTLRIHQLAEEVAVSEGPGPARAKVLRVPPDDSDMIVIVDDERSTPRDRSAAGSGGRQELRRLFSRLRER